MTLFVLGRIYITLKNIALHLDAIREIEKERLQMERARFERDVPAKKPLKSATFGTVNIEALNERYEIRNQKE